jgi:serine protease Do
MTRALVLVLCLAAAAAAKGIEDSIFVIRIRTEQTVATGVRKQTLTAPMLVVGADGLCMAAGFHIEPSTDPDEPVRIDAIGPDGRPFAAKLLGGDEDLECTFFRLEGDAASFPPPVSLDAAVTARPDDRVYFLSRHGPLLEFAPRRIEAHVDAATRGAAPLYGIREPRDAWIGSVVVTPDGKLVGFVDARNTFGEDQGISLGVGRQTLVIVAARSYADAARTPVKKVTGRAWLGVNLSPFDADREAFFSVGEDWPGALVTGISPGSPAADAGIRVHDVIQTIGPLNVRFEAQTDWNTMLRAVQRLPLGKPLTCRIVRFTRRPDGGYDAQRLEVTMTLAERPLDFADAPETEIKDLGLKVKPVTVDWRRANKLPAEQGGAVVTGTARASPAQLARLQPGDLIQRVDDAEVRDVASLTAVLDAARREKRGKIVLFVRRGTETLFLAVATGW